VAGHAASQSGRPGRDVAFAVATGAALTWYNNVAGRFASVIIGGGAVLPYALCARMLRIDEFRVLTSTMTRRFA
jgi:hypothetical protein